MKWPIPLPKNIIEKTMRPNKNTFSTAENPLTARGKSFQVSTTANADSPDNQASR